MLCDDDSFYESLDRSFEIYFDELSAIGYCRIGYMSLQHRF
ncbi:hypothetical protein QUA20_30925 [Microcoleus sp. Pol7_A1]